MALTWRPFMPALKLGSMRGVCMACGLQPIAEAYLCADCHHDTHWLPKPFTVALDSDDRQLSVQAASHYEGVMKYAIRSFKDKESLMSLPYLLHALYVLARVMIGCLPRDTLVLATPTTDKRLSARGFDPMAMLVCHLSQLTGFGIYQGVVRTGEQLKQRRLNRQERLENLHQAFEVLDLPTVRHVVLFDDVATTGATFKALADTLCKADKALQISAYCLAHGKSDYDKQLYKI